MFSALEDSLNDEHDANVTAMKDTRQIAIICELLSIVFFLILQVESFYPVIGAFLRQSLDTFGKFDPIICCWWLCQKENCKLSEATFSGLTGHFSGLRVLRDLISALITHIMDDRLQLSIARLDKSRARQI